MINIVHNCDCMDFMRDCKDKQFELAIPDPPYGIGWTKRLLNEQKTEKRRLDRESKGYKTHNVKDYDKEPPPQEYFDLLRKKSKYQIIWGGNYFTDKLDPVRCWVIWDKMNTFSSVNPEMAWTNFDKPINIFSRPHGLDKGFMNKTGGHIHPNQKPVALAKWLLKNFAQPGWTILDTHVGSGYMRIACYDMGFDFVGCEIDKYYWQAQEDRFQNHVEEAELFGRQELQKLIYNQGELT